MQNESTKEKKISIVANLTEGDRDYSRRMWVTYSNISKIAVEDFLKKKGRTYNPKIIFHDETTQQNDPLNPAKKINDAKNVENSLIAVGNAWSTIASIAADEAARIGQPYISPTAVTKRVHDGPYSISLGVNIFQASRAVKDLAAKLNKDRVVVVTDFTKIQEREYTETLTYFFSDSKIFDMSTNDLVDVVVNDVVTNPRSFIFIPGYAVNAQLATRIHKKMIALGKEPPVFITGPQWVYDNIMVNRFVSDHPKIQIWVVTDYQKPNSEIAKKINKKWEDIDHGGSGVFRHALYDAITIALEVLDFDDVDTREKVVKKMKNIGSIKNLSRSFVKIENGTVKKALYALKWEVKNFEKYYTYN